MDYSGPGQGQVADAFEGGDEPLGFMKRGDFILGKELLASQEGLCSTDVVCQTGTLSACRHKSMEGSTVDTLPYIDSFVRLCVAAS
jgi:hypothetical protein